MIACLSAQARRAAACTVALILAAGAFEATVAFAQDRHWREPERPYHTRHWVYDNRYHHGHYYPAIGYTLTVLPPGYVSLTFSNRRFFFQGGVWYQPAGRQFVVVRPPVGIVVPALPPAYTVVQVGGIPYYYANEVYYTGAPGGYVVVSPPAGGEVIVAAPPPPSAAPVPPPAPVPAPAPQAAAGVWYYCESAKAYYPYVGECKEGWRQVPAAPPH